MLTGMRLFGREIIFEEFEPKPTDGRTDGRTDYYVQSVNLINKEMTYVIPSTTLKYILMKLQYFNVIILMKFSVK